MTDLVDQDDDFLEKIIEDFTGGLNLSDRQDSIEDGQLIVSDNVFFEKGFVKVDTGYSTYLGVVRGMPRATFQFYKKNGSSFHVLVTDTSFYVEASDEWQYISNGTDTVTTATSSAGDFTVTVASITDFADGEYIGITLDDGTQHRTTINGSPAGSTITFDDAIPIGRSVANGAVVLEACAFTGSADVQPSLVTVPSHDWLVFTNGVDNIKRYDGADCIDLPNLPSSGNTTCKVVTLYDEYLLLIHTTEGGTAYPQRVRWDDTGDPTNWSTGNASYRDLWNSEDFLVAAAPLGPYIILYRERSIVRMEFVGATDLLFNFDPVIAGEGALSQDSVIDVGDHHIFIGNSNIYKYQGGFDFDPIGDDIYYHLFSISGELSPQYKNRTFAIYVEELDEVWIFYPSGSSQYPNDVLRYSFAYDSWTHREFADSFMGFGFYQATDSQTWNDLDGDWLAQNWAWNSSSVLANSPLTLLCATAANQVYSYDYQSQTDNGTTIDYEIITKEFLHPHFKIRCDHIEILVKGENILIEYSIDSGVSWDTMSIISPGATVTKIKVFKQFVGDSAMFRISGSGAGFALGRFRFEYILESES